MSEKKNEGRKMEYFTRKVYDGVYRDDLWHLLKMYDVWGKPLSNTKSILYYMKKESLKFRIDCGHSINFSVHT